MKRSIRQIPSRRLFLKGVGACALAGLSSNETFAQGILRAAGKMRRLNVLRGDNGQRLHTVYWIEGEYIAPAIEEINYFCRDAETNTVHAIDPRVIDIAAAVHNLLDTNEPFTLKRGFVLDRFRVRDGHFSEAQPSDLHHARGKALDISLRSRSVKQISLAAIRCNAGGVGSYPTRQYVHIDCGHIRNWSG